MNLLNDKIKNLYFHYLFAAVGGQMIMSIYTFVDTVVVGHYIGHQGTAAIAAFMPMWTFYFAFGLLFGVGGAVLMAQNRGAGKDKEANLYFTAAMLLAAICSALVFTLFHFCADDLLHLFGARGEIKELATAYGRPVLLAAPVFIIGQALAPMIRNDKHPGYATAAILTGGCFNIFGDFFFTYGLDLGIFGAGLATTLGQVVTFSILLLYFTRKDCRLHLEKDIFRNGLFRRMGQVLFMGAGTFVVDLSLGLQQMIFNNQIIRYYDDVVLSVYGMLANFGTIIHTFGYAVGESAQAVMSVNFGAGKRERVEETFRYMLLAAIVIGGVGFVLAEFFPTVLTNIYMTPTKEVLAVSPHVLRRFAPTFLFLVFNVAAGYYFQSIAKPDIAMTISLLRGIIISDGLLLLLPVIFARSSIWFAVPITEALVASLIFLLRKKRSA